MRIAKLTDWQTEVLPSQRAGIPVDRLFSDEDMTLICRGLLPEKMEDKWFIYWQDNTLFFHRSWTGFCIFMVRFIREDAGWRMDEAWANRDPEQYSVTSVELDAELLLHLVTMLLVH